MKNIEVQTKTHVRHFFSYMSSEDDCEIDLTVYCDMYFKSWKTMDRFFVSLKDHQASFPIVNLTLCSITGTPGSGESYDFLSYLTSLVKLELHSSFPVLEGIPHLPTLKCLNIFGPGDEISEIDLRGIEHHSSLEELSLTGNVIYPVMINHLTCLKKLAITESSIEQDLDLSSLDSLETLEITFSNLRKIIFPRAPGLVAVKMVQTEFKKLVGLNPSNLIEFCARECGLKDLAFLEGADRLKVLIACGNRFTDLSHFQGLVSLERACVSGEETVTEDIYRTAGPMSPYMALWLHLTKLECKDHLDCDSICKL